MFITSGPFDCRQAAGRRYSQPGSVHGGSVQYVANGTVIFFFSNYPVLQCIVQKAWDPVLAGVAQAYAEQCIFGHNAYRSSQYTAAASPNTVASYVGENLYVTSAGESTGLIASAIQNWYAEKSNYNFATGDCGSGQCGHYTQVSNIEKFAQFNITVYMHTVRLYGLKVT